MYVKKTRILAKEDLEEKINEYEKKYKMDFDNYFEKVVKGHEDELDAEGVLSDIEVWGSLVSTLEEMNEKKIPGPVETFIRPVPEERAAEIQKLFTKKRLELLQFIKTVEDMSISQISRQLHRDRKSVTEDLDLFSSFDFVKLERSGRKVLAKPEFSEIDIKIK